MKCLAVGVDFVPNRNRHAEEALTADEPVAVEAVDPVFVTNAHERRNPVEFLAAFDQRVSVFTRLDEPLPAADNLEWLVALLVELHRVLDLLRLTDEVARVAQQFDDLVLCRLCFEAFELRVCALCFAGIDAIDL